MNTIQVKICGIQEIDSALAAIYAGADFLGFNFVPSSKRFINPVAAKKIAKHIKGKSKMVGVFQNAAIDEVNRQAHILQLDYVQFHGNETATYCEHIKAPIIKKISLQKAVEQTEAVLRLYKHTVTLFLIDRPKQGEGPMVDLQHVKKLTKKYPLFLAGGLDNQNITTVMEEAGRDLYGIDISSGVENIFGRKDKILMGSFIQKVRRVYVSH